MNPHIVILSAVLMATLGAAEVGTPVTVPDPFGLGERLAIIDFLHDKKIEVAPGTTIDDLRAQYLQITTPHVDPAVEAEQHRQQAIAARLRSELLSLYQFKAPETADVATLTHLLDEQAANAQEQDRLRLLGILEHRFTIHLPADSSYTAVKGAYNEAAQSIRTVAADTGSSDSTMQHVAKKSQAADSTASEAAAPSSTTYSPVAQDGKTPVTASKHSVEPQQYSPPVSTQPYWQNYASSPSVEKDNVWVSIYLSTDKGSPNSTLHLADEDSWSKDIRFGGFYHFVCASGWDDMKTVTIDLEGQSITIQVPGKNKKSLIHTAVHGTDRLPIIKITDVH